VVPIGEWGRPADLDVHSESLKDVKVAIFCGDQDAAGKLTSRSFRTCTMLSEQLQQLGAITVLENEPADFKLWFIDLGSKVEERAGWFDYAFYFTVGLVPMVSTKLLQAELRVTDARGVLLERTRMGMNRIQVVGWMALLTMFLKNERQNEREVSRKFYQFAKNRIVSQVARLKPRITAGAN
jgi:hypothetical protein